MNIFIARQPIFNSQGKVFAYELLFRSGQENVFRFQDGDQASQRVIDSSLHIFGLSNLTDNKKAFINITKDLLLRPGLVSLLPPENAVLEILETVEPEDEVISACSSLKRTGYILALDDFVMRPGYERLIAFADVIKVDFLATSDEEERKILAAQFVPKGINLLAEKVETHEDFTWAKQFGYVYFQGYFFCKPEMISANDIPAYKLNYLRFIQEVLQPDLNFNRLEQIIKQEISLSVKLLRYINSAWFGLRARVDSIRQALVLLGERMIRQWASLVAFTSMVEDKPTELVITCLVRAKFCELLSPFLNTKGQEMDLFLMGMLSGLDAVIGRPLDELLSEIPISKEIKEALTGSSNQFYWIYQLALSYERADWENVTKISNYLGVNENMLPDIYHQSIQWVNKIFHL